ETAYVHLGAWLREREMMRTEFCFCLRSEQFLRKHFQCSFQIGEGDMFVNDKSFDLVEGRRMGCVHLIRTEHTSRRDHTDRQLALLHHAGLYRRSLGTENNLIIEDRKSTRLNSSHVSISYAVFCLKKKRHH